MITPSEEPTKVENVRMGMVQVSDGKSRPKPARLVLSMDKVIIQEEVTVSAPARDRSVPQTRERMVQLRRLKVGGLGLSIKGGAEHKLPILISKIYKDQAADQTGQLFVGDAVIKVNGEYITACSHDDAVGILRGAGDIVVLTVRHYRAAAPFLAQQEGTSDNESLAGDEHPSSHNGVKSPAAVDDNSNPEHPSDHVNGGWQGRESRPGSAASVRRPSSVSSDVTTTQWKEIAAVPLMMAYVTRFIPGTDKLRPGAFEVNYNWPTKVRGARCESTGVIHIDQPAALSHWIKAISDNIVGLTSLQMKLLNRQLSSSERIEHMCWVAEGEGRTGGGGAYFYVPRFLVLQGTDLLLYTNPPMNLTELGKSPERLKVYQCVVRVVKESETLDWRQHCFLLQWETRPTRYFSAETKRELLRIEAAWTATLLNAVLRLGKKTFTVVSGGKAGSLTLDWGTGFTLTDGVPGSQPLWTYRFSQLRGSSDDSKSKLKLHFQDPETKVIETKELECQILQSLLFCMHAFLTAKVASVDPAFLASIQQTHN